MKYGLTASRRRLDGGAQTEIEDEIEELVSRGHSITMAVAHGFGARALSKLMQVHGDELASVNVVLPTKLDVFTDYYFEQAKKGEISEFDAKKFVGNLKHLKKQNALTELNHKECTDDAFNACNEYVVDEAETVIVYHVDGSPIVEKTISYAQGKNVPIKVKKYIMG